MKSKDLVNGAVLNYACDTLADNEALTLQDGTSAYGAGSWANSLRHQNGTLYATTFSSTSGWTQVYRTQDNEKRWRSSRLSVALPEEWMRFRPRFPKRAARTIYTD